MKSKLLIITLSFVLCFTCAVAASADKIDDYGEPKLVADRADILTDSEEAYLLSKLGEISDKHSVNVSIVILPYTMNEKGEYIGMAVDTCANLMFDTFGYGYGDSEDGVLFLVVTDTREWYITSVGYGAYAITDAGYDYIENEVIPYLSAGNYAGAFSRYAEICDELITHAKNGEPYEYDYSDDYYNNSVSGDPYSVSWIGICIVIGAIIAIIIVLVMASKNKSVRTKTEANSYIRPGSMNVTVSRDMFLYRNVSRIKRPNDSNGSHKSSGGGRSFSSGGRSGRGGKF